MHEYGAATEQYRVLLLRFISRRNPLLQHGIGISPPKARRPDSSERQLHLKGALLQGLTGVILGLLALSSLSISSIL